MRRRRRRDPAAIAGLLGRATRRFTGPNDSVLTSVRAAWPESSGAGTVNHAYPIRRSRTGVVTVACADAVWAQELNMRADELTARLNRIVGNPEAVAGLRFVVADHALPPVEVGPRAAVAPLPPSAVAQEAGARAAQSIDDPALRDLVARAAARSIDRSKG